MKRVLLASIIAAASMSLAAPLTAEAQNEGQDKKKVKEYDFSGDTIDGDLIRPDGEMLDARDFASHTSLISIRKDFIKEIIKSAEDL